MKKLLLIVIFLYLIYPTGAQSHEHIDALLGAIDQKVKEDVDKTLKEIKETEKKAEEGDRLYASGDLSKAVSILEKSSNIFETNYRELFLLLDEKISVLIKELEGERKDYSLYLQSQAGNYFRISIAERLTADKEKDDKTAFEGYKRSHENEVKAIDRLSHTYAYITGLIYEEPDIPEIILPYTTSISNTVTNNYMPHSFVVENAELPNDFSFETGVITTDSNHSNTNNSQPNQHQTVHYNKTENTYQNSDQTKGHEFRIQIGISILPANDWQLKQINKTDFEVKTYKSKIYYKYTVGSFVSFQEAKNYKNAYGLKDTYIVEYNDGKEVKFYYGNVEQ